MLATSSQLFLKYCWSDTHLQKLKYCTVQALTYYHSATSEASDYGWMLPGLSNYRHKLKKLHLWVFFFFKKCHFTFGQWICIQHMKRRISRSWLRLFLLHFSLHCLQAGAPLASFCGWYERRDQTPIELVELCQAPNRRQPEQSQLVPTVTCHKFAWILLHW